MSEYPQSVTALDPINQYFRKLFFILRHPVEFYSQLNLKGGMGEPLAFAIITKWVGTGVAFLWSMATGLGAGQYYDRLLDQYDRSASSVPAFLSTWFFGVGAVLVDPFFTLLSILVSSFFLFLGARFFIGTAKNLTYEAIVRIQAYTFAASSFLVVPYLGSFSYGLYAFILLVLGIKHCFATTGGTSFLIAVFPMAIFFGLILFIILGFVALGIGLAGLLSVL